MSVLFVELIQKFDHIMVQLPLVGVGKLIVNWKVIELLDRIVVAKLIGRQSSYLIFQILKNIVERSGLKVHV